MKPYHQIAIVDCGESLVPIPAETFALLLPHPYEKLGAPYGNQSPFYLRQTVLDRLIAAQTLLQSSRPGWKIQVFDAYRPIAVQQFMVDYTFQELVQAQNLKAEQLTEPQRQEILAQVYEFWAVPNPDPAMPPPHSTGAAIDVTLVNEVGQPVDMGSPIDEVSPRSYPNYFADRPEAAAQTCHRHRQLLNQVMTENGFQRHPNEWWHFCCGDQMWAWLTNQQNPATQAISRYGRIL